MGNREAKWEKEENEEEKRNNESFRYLDIFQSNSGLLRRCKYNFSILFYCNPEQVNLTGM